MKRIRITGLSGTGKSTVLEFMKNDNRFVGLGIDDLDNYFPERFYIGMQTDKQFGQKNRDRVEKETVALAVKSKNYVLGGLVMNPINLEFLKKNKFEIIELCLSIEERRERVRKRSLLQENREHEYGNTDNQATIGYQGSIMIDGNQTTKDVADLLWDIIQE